MSTKNNRQKPMFYLEWAKQMQECIKGEGKLSTYNVIIKKGATPPPTGYIHAYAPVKGNEFLSQTLLF